jgi:NAD+ dependent glucose-6-phosphate dehydrogenase
MCQGSFAPAISGKGSAMKVLITGAASKLGRAIATELAPDCSLRLMDTLMPEPDTQAEWFQGSLLDPQAIQQAVQGVQAVIHTGEPPVVPAADVMVREHTYLDWATRGTHQLMKIAIEAGAKRFVYGSTLEIFGTYPDDVYISELWKPLPTPEIASMSRYLGELTCREFTRDYQVSITALRLGRLVREEEVADHDPDLMWVDLRDAAQAFRCAVNRDTGNQVWWTRRWSLFHICAGIPNPKFLIGQAASIGYKPQHNFQRNWSRRLSRS